MIDCDHDEDIPHNAIVSGLHEDIEMKETHQASSSQLEIVANNDMDIDDDYGQEIVPGWYKTISKFSWILSSSNSHLTFNGELLIEAYSDLDRRGSRDGRRSTSGIMVMLNGTPVVYKSRLQKSVTLSSAEAEYMAMTICVQEIFWVKHLLQEMGHPFERPIQFFVENQSAIVIATNDGNQSREKHIDIRHQFIREHVKSGIIKLWYILT
uniref:Putative polyprotein n=1 Tax=Albugo laibachii Nc14 TaxID=890382 RepID=F0W631_9STRA|nr:putative polyprotein [Albugo laibachii Nc14]|eukprot:CCA16573.1 putative polyprotein [Albugo laibachii Nc14]